MEGRNASSMDTAVSSSSSSSLPLTTTTNVPVSTTAAAVVPPTGIPIRAPPRGMLVPPPPTATMNRLAYFHKLYGGDNSIHVKKLLKKKKQSANPDDGSESITSASTTNTTGTNENSKPMYKNENSEDDTDDEDDDDISDTSLPPALEDRLQNYSRKQFEMEAKKNKNNDNKSDSNPRSCNETPSSYISIPTVEQIVEAMPTSASCVAHVLDRRINLDQFPDPPDRVNMYQLLRAWVQDDPYRYPPIPSTTIAALDPLHPSSPTTTTRNQHPSSRTTINTTKTLLSSSTNDTQPLSTSPERMDLISQLVDQNNNLQDHAYENKKRYAMEDLQKDWANRQSRNKQSQRMESKIQIRKDQKIWNDLQRRGLVQVPPATSHFHKESVDQHSHRYPLSET